MPDPAGWAVKAASQYAAASAGLSLFAMLPSAITVPVQLVAGSFHAPTVQMLLAGGGICGGGLGGGGVGGGGVGGMGGAMGGRVRSPEPEVSVLWQHGPETDSP